MNKEYKRFFLLIIFTQTIFAGIVTSTLQAAKPVVDRVATAVVQAYTAANQAAAEPILRQQLTTLESLQDLEEIQELAILWNQMPEEYWHIILNARDQMSIKQNEIFFESFYIFLMSKFWCILNKHCAHLTMEQKKNHMRNQVPTVYNKIALALNKLVSGSSAYFLINEEFSRKEYVKTVYNIAKNMGNDFFDVKKLSISTMQFFLYLKRHITQHYPKNILYNDAVYSYQTTIYNQCFAQYPETIFRMAWWEFMKSKQFTNDMIQQELSGYGNDLKTCAEIKEKFLCSGVGQELQRIVTSIMNQPINVRQIPIFNHRKLCSISTKHDTPACITSADFVDGIWKKVEKDNLALTVLITYFINNRSSVIYENYFAPLYKEPSVQKLQEWNIFPGSLQEKPRKLSRQEQKQALINYKVRCSAAIKEDIHDNLASICIGLLQKCFDYPINSEFFESNDWNLFLGLLKDAMDHGEFDPVFSGDPVKKSFALQMILSNLKQRLFEIRIWQIMQDQEKSYDRFYKDFMHENGPMMQKVQEYMALVKCIHNNPEFEKLLQSVLIEENVARGNVDQEEQRISQELFDQIQKNRIFAECKQTMRCNFNEYLEQIKKLKNHERNAWVPLFEALVKRQSVIEDSEKDQRIEIAKDRQSDMQMWYNNFQRGIVQNKEQDGRDAISVHEHAVYKNFKDTLMQVLLKTRKQEEDKRRKNIYQEYDISLQPIRSSWIGILARYGVECNHNLQLRQVVDGETKDRNNIVSQYNGFLINGYAQRGIALNNLRKKNQEEQLQNMINYVQLDIEQQRVAIQKEENLHRTLMKELQNQDPVKIANNQSQQRNDLNTQLHATRDQIIQSENQDRARLFILINQTLSLMVLHQRRLAEEREIAADQLQQQVRLQEERASTITTIRDHMRGVRSANMPGYHFNPYALQGFDLL